MRIVNCNEYSQLSKLLAKDGVTSDWFGTSVSIYSNNAFIGAAQDTFKGVDSGISFDVLILQRLLSTNIFEGSVYYYTLTGSYWSYQAKIVSKDAFSSDYFGSSVSIYNNNALIGAIFDDDLGDASGTYVNNFK